MAKKKTGTTPKESKVEEKTVDSVEVIEDVNKNELPVLIKRGVESLTIEELINYEKACSKVCGRYEVSARLSGENNLKFMEFLDYHKMFLNELEKRVVDVCKKIE